MSSTLRVTTLDGIALSGSIAGAVWAALAVLKVQPMFLDMFKDFGASLPQLTQLAVRGWFPLVLAIPGPVCVGAGILSDAKPPLRETWAAVSLVFAIAAPATFMFAMYLPIFAIAEAVK